MNYTQKESPEGMHAANTDEDAPTATAAVEQDAPTATAAVEQDAAPATAVAKDAAPDDAAAVEESTKPVIKKAAAPAAKKSTKSAAEKRSCQKCDASTTPWGKWRDGPGGKATLCNRCGLQWKKRGAPEDWLLADEGCATRRTRE